MNNKFNVLDLPEKFPCLDREIRLNAVKIFFKTKGFLALFFGFSLTIIFLAYISDLFYPIIFPIIFICMGIIISSNSYFYRMIAVEEMMEKRLRKIDPANPHEDDEYIYLSKKDEYYFRKIIDK